MRSKLYHKYNSRARVETREDVITPLDHEAVEAAERIGASIEALGYDLSSNSYFSLSESDSDDRYEPVSPTTSQTAEQVNETYSPSCFDEDTASTDFLDHSINEQTYTGRYMHTSPVGKDSTGGNNGLFDSPSTEYQYSHGTIEEEKMDRGNAMNSVTSDDFLSVVQPWRESSDIPNKEDKMETGNTSLSMTDLLLAHQTRKRHQRMRSSTTRDLNHIFLSDKQDQPIQYSHHDEQLVDITKESALDTGPLLLDAASRGPRRGKRMNQPCTSTKSDTIFQGQDKAITVSGVSSVDLHKTSSISKEKGTFTVSRSEAKVSKANTLIIRRDASKVIKSQSSISRWGSPRRTTPDEQYLLRNNTTCLEHEMGSDIALAHEQNTRIERSYPKIGLMKRFSDKAVFPRMSPVDLATKTDDRVSAYIPSTTNTNITAKRPVNKRFETFNPQVSDSQGLTMPVATTTNILMGTGDNAPVTSGTGAKVLNTHAVRSEVVINSVTHEALDISTHKDLRMSTKPVQVSSEKMSFMKRSRRGFKRLAQSTTNATVGSIKNMMSSSAKGKRDASLSHVLIESEPTTTLVDSVETCLTPVEKLLDTKPPKFISKKVKCRGPYIKPASLIHLPSIGEVIEANSSEKFENVMAMTNTDLNDVYPIYPQTFFDTQPEQDTVDTALTRRKEDAVTSQVGDDFVENDILPKPGVSDDVSLSNWLRTSKTANISNAPASWLKCFANISIERDPDNCKEVFKDEASEEDDDEVKADIHEKQQSSFFSCCGFGYPRTGTEKSHAHDMDSESSKSQSTFDNDEFEEFVEAVRTLSLTYPTNEIGSIASLAQEDDISVSDERYNTITKAVAVIKRHAALYEVTEEELVSALAYRTEQQESDDWMMEVGEATDDFFDQVGNYLRIRGR